MTTGLFHGALERRISIRTILPANVRVPVRHKHRHSCVVASSARLPGTVTTTIAPDLAEETPEMQQLSAPVAHRDPELELFLRLLPPSLRSALEGLPNLDQLVEVVLDLGRPAYARFPSGDVRLSPRPLATEDIDQAVAQVGDFDGDNRAGIDSTLHRISAIRNRSGRVVGLTCRVGRSVAGAAQLVRDLVLEGRSVLLLGRPGVGKTTALREVCRIAADEARRRVVIVDTSNEIGGDGDVPHPSIGGARRMQVPRPEAQHAVMVEAVENHMPQVVVIDEISTLAECSAARTIAQRGVQLVATAHGNRLENVIKNPTLADLVGGIQSVTLGDEEARRRGVQKSILERAAPPTFDVAVEMEERGRWRVHLDVAAAVDSLLAGGEASGQVRFMDGSGQVTRANFMGLVRRTGTDGRVATSEWWADESGGGEEPLIWPSRQDTRPPPAMLPMRDATSGSSSSAASRLPTGGSGGPGGVGATRLPGGNATGAFGTTPSSRAANVAAAVAPLATAVQSVYNKSSGTAARPDSSGGASSPIPGSTAASSAAAASSAPEESGARAATSPFAMPDRIRVFLVADDTAAARVRAVLGLLRREAYEAALAAAEASGGASYSSGSGGGSASVQGSGSELIEVVRDLAVADMVVGTKARLRSSPKVRNIAKKRGLPIYTLASTSTSALLRNLCPLLGLDPLAVEEVVRAAGGLSNSGGRGAGGEAADEGEGEEGDEGLEAAMEQVSSSGSSAGSRRTLELSAADDYAELLATTVRELRYAPIDRSYAQYVLGRFVEEMMGNTSASPPSGPAGDPPGSAGSPGVDDQATAASAEAVSPTESSAPVSQAASGVAAYPPAAANVRASSLAAMVWACSFVKHRKRFRDGCRKELALLATACGQRWSEFSAQELLRIATGFAALRYPLDDVCLQGLTAAAQEALESGEATAEAAAAGTAEGGRRRGGPLSADEASRLQLALAELDVGVRGPARQHAGEDGGEE